MASGTALTAGGMTTMTQVVAGDIIDDADFDNARANVDKLLGVATGTVGGFSLAGTYGYSQGGSGIGEAIAGTVVKAAGVGNGSTISGGFAELQADVVALCAFLGITPRSGVSSLVTTSTTITASTWSNLMLDLRDCWNSRFSPAALSVTTAGATRQSITNDGLSNWTGSIQQVTSWTFSNAETARKFFNMGGRIGLSLASTAGTAQDANWSTLFGNLGDVLVSYDNTATSAGTNSFLGYYELSTGSQQLVAYNGGTGPYSADKITISAYLNAGQNVVYIVTKLDDTTDGNIDQPTTANITMTAKYTLPGANGSGFSIPSVGSGITVSAGAWTAI